MISFFTNLNLNPIFLKIKSWVILLGVTGIAQVLVQALGLVSGILVIRVLPTEEYALYTLGNTMLGSMVLLSNGGISTGVMAQGSKVWQDKFKLGEVMVTGFNLRKKFTLLGLIIGIPILLFLLKKNNASWLVSILIILALIPAFISSLSNSLLVIVPKLHQNIIPLQKNQVGVNLGRLLLLALTIFIFPFAYIAILSSSIPQIIGNVRLRKIALKHVDLNQQPSESVQKEILKTVKRVFPEAIYYSFSSQITIWLLSIFGTTTSLAQVGAMGRISIALSIIPLMFGVIIIPRFVRLTENFHLLLDRYSKVILLLLVIFLSVVGLVSVFTDEVLWVLGPKYSSLQEEIVLVIIGTSLSLSAGIIYSMYSGRGWIQHPILAISFNIVTIVIGVIFTDVSTLHGVLILNIIIGLSQLLTHGVYGFYKIFELKLKKKHI